MLIKVLKRVLGETHALLISMLLFHELFSRRTILLVIKDNLSILSLDIYNLAVSLHASVFVGLVWAELWIVANWLAISLVVTLRLLLTIHS